MGHLSNPILLRLGITRSWESRGVVNLKYNIIEDITKVLQDVMLQSFRKSEMLRRAAFVFSHSIIRLSKTNPISITIFTHDPFVEIAIKRYRKRWRRLFRRKKKFFHRRRYMVRNRGRFRFLRFRLKRNRKNRNRRIQAGVRLNIQKYFSRRFPIGTLRRRRRRRTRLKIFLLSSRRKRRRYRVARKRRNSLLLIGNYFARRLMFRVIRKRFVIRNITAADSSNNRQRFVQQYGRKNFNWLKRLSISQQKRKQFFAIYNRMASRGAALLRRFLFHKLRGPFFRYLSQRVIRRLKFRGLRKQGLTNFKVSFSIMSSANLTTRAFAYFAWRRLIARNTLNQTIFPVLKGISSNFLGFQVLCVGRFTRRQRASVKKYTNRGKVPKNTFSVSMDYAFMDYPLKFGASSLKFWLTKFKTPVVG